MKPIAIANSRLPGAVERNDEKHKNQNNNMTDVVTIVPGEIASPVANNDVM